MATKKSRYGGEDDLSAATAILAAANMLIDVGDIAYEKQDTETLLEAGDRLLRLGAVMMHGVDALSEEVSSQTSDGEGEDGAKVKIGFSAE